MVLQNESKSRTWFVCDGNDGHCCDEYIELNHWMDEHWFTHVSRPQGIWSLLKQLWRHRKMYHVEIIMSRADLLLMRDAIIRELDDHK